MNYPQLWKSSGIAVSLLLAAMAATGADAANYQVRSGDTFTAISKKHNISFSGLQKANPGLNPHRISVGQLIAIPGNSVKTAASHPTPENRQAAKQKPVIAKAPPGKPIGKKSTILAKPRRNQAIANYRVQSSDTLGSIARRKGTSVSELMAMNDLNNMRLSPGQVLIVPATNPRDRNAVDISPPVPRARESKPAPKKSPAAAPVPEPTYYHIVKRKENFSSIAAEHGVSRAQLARLNKGVNPESLRADQKLILPSPRIASRQPDREPVRSRLISSREQRIVEDSHISAAPHSADPLPPIEEESTASIPTGVAPRTAYKVSGADTLESISKQFGTTPLELRRINNMSDFDKLITNNFIQVPWAAPSRDQF